MGGENDRVINLTQSVNSEPLSAKEELLHEDRRPEVDDVSSKNIANHLAKLRKETT